MQNRQKPSLHWRRPRNNRLNSFSSAAVVFLCWSNYHVRLIVLLMTVINQVLLPNLRISSSLQYTRADHTGWKPDVSSFGERNCVLVCNFMCNRQLCVPTLLFWFFFSQECVFSQHTQVSNCYSSLSSSKQQLYICRQELCNLLFRKLF